MQRVTCAELVDCKVQARKRQWFQEDWEGLNKNHKAYKRNNRENNNKLETRDDEEEKH